MARVTYFGDHTEPSFAFRVTKGDAPVEPFGVVDGARSRRIEVICLPQGIERVVNPFAALYLAAVRRRHGPWFRVRVSPAEYAEVRRRAPWLRKARAGKLTSEGPVEPEMLQDDAILLCDTQVTAGLQMAAVRPYETL